MYQQTTQAHQRSGHVFYSFSIPGLTCREKGVIFTAEVMLCFINRNLDIRLNVISYTASSTSKMSECMTIDREIQHCKEKAQSGLLGFCQQGVKTWLHGNKYATLIGFTKAETSPILHKLSHKLVCHKWFLCRALGVGK